MKCPKCGVEIKRFDLSPNCKKCGVHIMYYTQEADLMRDAKRTELEFASARVLVEKLKTAFIKGKMPILRILTGIMALASLLLPLFSVNFSFPWWQYKISVSVLGVYSIISDSFWKLLPSLGALGVGEGLYTITLASLIVFLATAIFMLICLALWLVSFLNIKKTAKLLCVFSSLGIVCALANTVLSVIAVNISGGLEFISVSPMYGGLLSAVCLGAFLATNIVFSINTPEIYIKDADRKRIEISRQLKKGEITLDELPLPVVEEDESDKDKKAEKGKKKKRGKKK